jgi:hypothetical protein
VEGTAQDVEGPSGQIHSQEAQLGTDFTTFNSDQGALSSYAPANPPSQDQVTQATTNANASLATAVSSVNGLIDQANADVNTAYQYAAQAYQVGSCGSAPTPPAPQPHIS